MRILNSRLAKAHEVLDRDVEIGKNWSYLLPLSSLGFYNVSRYFSAAGDNEPSFRGNVT